MTDQPAHVCNPQTCTNPAHTPLGQAEAARDGAYRERAHLVALLAATYPAEFREDPEDDEWSILYVQLPTGQASWHIHPRDMDLFSHVKFGTAAEWDGHTTDEKYARIDELTRQLHEAPGPGGGDRG